MFKILIADNQRSVRNSLKERLEFEGYETALAATLPEGLEWLAKASFDMIISEEPFFNEYMNAVNPNTFPAHFIITTDSPDLPSAVRVFRNGAVDYISKPIDMNSLMAAIKRSERDLEPVQAASPAAPQRPSSPAARKRVKNDGRVSEIIGESKAIMRVKNLIDKVGPSEARVLVTGANGTGKELVAHWLHYTSPRADAPFVEVNCAAIPSELIESELFGHEKGAFTSAIKQRKGKFEQAHGGTLFLDEIGDMSLSAQAKVLRALQENRITRVGSDKDISVDVRIVAATNKDLREEIVGGRFREDLYHRLSVIVITVPALRDRIDDIPILVDHFMDKLTEEYGMPRKKVEKEAIDALQSMPWTGNIRELRNVVERLIILCNDKVTAQDVADYAIATTL